MIFGKMLRAIDTRAKAEDFYLLTMELQGKKAALLGTDDAELRRLDAEIGAAFSALNRLEGYEPRFASKEARIADIFGGVN